MKLYYYDHCPYCTRVRMIFGLCNIPFEHEILANDDEETPINLIGRKVLPILIKDDGTAMGESLDIVQYVSEQVDHFTLDTHVRPALQTWLEQISHDAMHLVMPRATAVGYQEFTTQSAKDYYTRKKTELVGDFADNIANSHQYIAHINSALMTLAPIISGHAANGKIAGMEDILLFPILRNLTTVKGIQWPSVVSTYLYHFSQRSDIPLMFNHAI